MQEDFLHYIWRYKKFNMAAIKTTNNEVVTIVSVGQHNQNSGPDFFNAQLKIGNQLWAGNVEIHKKSSDWFLHNHEQDKAYDTVILHVVWEHDTPVFRKNNSEIPTLELKSYISKCALNNYQQLFSKTKKWINCEQDFESVDSFIVKNWLERLYVERLEQKAAIINRFLDASKNDWEAVLFKMLAKNFGLKVNADAFLSMANSIDYAVVRKQQHSQNNLEALFFGQSGLLNTASEDAYFQNLLSQYQFLKQKFKLSNSNIVPVQFFRLRPSNFPTIRLSQLASLYGKESNLFSKINKVNTLDEFYTLFSVKASSFWESHYTFDKVSKKSKKQLHKAFIDLLMINTIIPIKFAFAKQQGKHIEGRLMELIQQISPEKNGIINKFNALKNLTSSALESQGLLQLKREYCDKNKCLHCAIGTLLLNKN